MTYSETAANTNATALRDAEADLPLEQLRALGRHLLGGLLGHVRGRDPLMTAASRRLRLITTAAVLAVAGLAAVTPAHQEPASPINEQCSAMLDTDPEDLARWAADRNGIPLDKARAAVDEATATSCDLELAGGKRHRTFTIKAITHNIAGGALHYGRPAALRVVERQIRHQRPHVVMMQEVCISQAEEFQRRHPDWHLAWSQTRYSHPSCDGDPDPATTDPAECDEDGACAPNGDELGDVIASPRHLRNVTRTNLGHPRLGRHQVLLCADVRRVGETVRACTTHIMTRKTSQLPGEDPTAQAQQIASVARLTAPYRKRGPVVIGGDFNTSPADPILAPMWDRFQEVHQRTRRAPRTGRPRIDYLWYGGLRRGRHAADGNLVRGTVSDHPIIRGIGHARKR